MKIKTGENILKELQRLGISLEHAKVIEGKSCKPVGTKTSTFIQVEFDGQILNCKEPFVFCVPSTCIE